MKNKNKLIEEFLKTPIKAGDRVLIQGLGSQNKTSWGSTTVEKIDDEYIYYHKYGYPNLEKVEIFKVKKCTDHIGANPFQPITRLDTHKIDIRGLLFYLGYEFKNKTTLERKVEQLSDGLIAYETNFDPFILDEDENEIHYQRGLVWSEEQKQLLIESIYNHIDIGKFVFRDRPFEWVEKRTKEGKGAFFRDMVDGKQRSNAIIDFLQNKFKDLSGNYFKNLSIVAQKKMLSYNNLQCATLPESATDQDVKNAFLAINFAGTPMSREHIEFVKSINVKK